MKKNKILFLFLSFIFEGCLYETPPIKRIFTIVNNSNYPLYIQSKTINDAQTLYDTVVVGGEYKRDFKQFYCYDDYYKDTLIAAFFKTLKIDSPKGIQYIDLFIRKKWKETFNLKGNTCKGGEIYYELTINNENIK
jgi:hypothetical protein